VIEHALSVLDNALLQGLAYGIAVIGVAVAFRVLRYPDLTADGSFLIGAAVFGALSLGGWHWLLAAGMAVVAGAVAGGLTAVLHTKAGVNRLLSGILTAMMCYSMAFWVLSGRSNLNLAQQGTMYSWAEAVDRVSRWSGSDVHLAMIAVSAVIAAGAVALVVVLLQSEFGVVMRATGENESLVEGLGRRPSRYHTVGLMLANGLVGLAGCLVAARQGFADVNMGFGVIITLVAALVIGEEVVRLFGLTPSRSLTGRVLSGVVGACVYFLLYLVILRASILGWLPVRIQPTDLKLMSALIVIVFVVIRSRTRPRGVEREEVLPI
jgi:putative ABC transport system permease protein